MGAKKLITKESIAAKLDELPTLPAIVYELSQLINDPMSSTAEVEEIMSNDQSLSVKVLKLVNSAYYAIPGGVTTLSRAIGYLGFDTVNQLVLSASIFNALRLNGSNAFNVSELWKHAFGSAIASETIGKHIHHPLPAELFVCGLLHDIGKVALCRVDPDLLIDIMETVHKNDCTFLDAEAHLSMPSHCEIGALLAKRWKLPPKMQATITYHHSRDPNSRKRITSDISLMVDVVYLANLLVHALHFGDSGHKKVMGAPREILERLTIDPDAGFSGLLKEIQANLSKASDFLKLLESET